jgi:hypothetical protein
MQIYAYNSGGFGNAVFSYLSSILFTILFDAEIINMQTKTDILDYKSKVINITDSEFIRIIEAKLNHDQTLIDCTQNYFLPGFYQHDKYYIQYKKEIIEYIKTHGDYKIFASHVNEPYFLRDVIQYVETPIYDLAIHIRLGDFIELGWTINPLYMKDLWNIIGLSSDKKVCIVAHPTNSVVEEQYIRFLQILIPHAILEMNTDPMRDYNILRNARRLVCSCSTMSWIASMFSNVEDQFVYFPNYRSRWNHEQFRKPHDRIEYYDIKRSYQTELWEIFKYIPRFIKTYNPRILFLNTSIHHKNLFALQNYKNVIIDTVYSIEECLNQDFLWYDVIYSPACPIDVKQYPHVKFLFGPHFSVFPDPNQMNTICGENAIYLQPSKWAVNAWKNEYDCCKDICFEDLPWGVDTERFTPGKTNRDKVFIYYKARNPKDLEFIETELQKRNVSYKIFSYTNRYSEEEYLQYMRESKYGIWVDAHESQGFALLEALSCDVPLLVWNIQYMSEEYGSSYKDIPASTIPYWDDQCGEYFFFKDQFSTAYDEFMENIRLDKYTPRNYILNNVSMEICERKLINIIHSM